MHPVVENRGAAPATVPPPGACPRLTLFDGFSWQHAVFPQCPSEPFETDLPVCGTAPCPRPCRVIETYPDIPPVTKAIRYDANGQWIASVQIAGGSNAPRGGELPRAVTYDHGRLVRTTDMLGEELTLVYVGDRVVRFDNRVDPTRIDYDAAGRIVAVVKLNDPDQPTTYTYDRAGYLVELVDGYKERSTFRYDERTHRLVHVASELHGGDGVAASVTLAYDAEGRIARITNEETVDHVYAYTTSYDYCDP